MRDILTVIGQRHIMQAVNKQRNLMEMLLRIISASLILLTIGGSMLALKEGDRTDHVTVVKIAPPLVTFVRNGDTITRSLLEESVDSDETMPGGSDAPPLDEPLPEEPALQG